MRRALATQQNHTTRQLRRAMANGDEQPVVEFDATRYAHDDSFEDALLAHARGCKAESATPLSWNEWQLQAYAIAAHYDDAPPRGDGAAYATRRKAANMVVYGAGWDRLVRQANQAKRSALQAAVVPQGESAEVGEGAVAGSAMGA